MRQLVYTSKAAPGLGQDDVFQIVQTSAGRNGDAGLCGFLIYQNGNFFQVLEGASEAIDEVFARICKDTRHSAIEVASDRAVDSLHFDRWRMKRVGGGAESAAIVLKDIDGQLTKAGVKASVDKFLRENS